MTVIKLPAKRLADLEERLAILEAKVQTIQVENNLYEYLLCCLIDCVENDDARQDMKDFLNKQALMYLNEPTYLTAFELKTPMTYGQVVARMAQQMNDWKKIYGDE